MRILNVRLLEQRQTSRGFTPVARFNVELTPEFILFDWLLSQDADGNDRVFAAMSGHGQPTATIGPKARAAIIQAVRREMKGAAHDRRAA